MSVKKKLLLAFIVLLGAIQLVQPDRSAPPIRAEETLEARYEPPDDVAKLLRGACYDCHSYESRWPWYSRLAPLSWIVAYDVREARKHVNFSTIARESARDQEDLLDECEEMVEKGEMPLEAYAWTHREARLSGADRKRLAEWFKEASRRAR